VPNHSSNEHEWFKKSVQGDVKYKDYYVWQNGRPNGDARPLEPNNWVRFMNKKSFYKEIMTFFLL
jgi:alpha-glucosidase